MTSLESALYRLLHKRAYRRAFLDGRFDVLELPESALAALQSVDPQALEALSERIAASVLEREYSGSGSLLETYPRTIAAFRAARSKHSDLLELGYAFLESAAFDGYRELPYRGTGTALEEAFFRYCELAEIGIAAVREHEFLAAMMRLLAVSPRAAIELPDCIQRVEHGFYAVSTRAVPTLYAAVRGHVVSGALTPFLRDLLAPGARPEALAARHGAAPPVLEASLSRLVALGLLPASAPTR